MSSSGDSMAQADDKGASGDTSVPRDTGTLGKLMVLLDLVTHADAPLRFTDILALANQPRGTLHRQLGHLVEEGLLEFDAEGRYAPGLRLLDFASRSWARNEFRLIAAPHLAALHRETGETVHLGVLRGSSIIYLDKVEGHQPVRMYSQIGNASPCYCTGVGKAALSVLPLDKIGELLPGLHFNRFTSATHVSAESLLAEIGEIAATGLCFRSRGARGGHPLCRRPHLVGRPLLHRRGLCHRSRLPALDGTSSGMGRSGSDDSTENHG